MTPADRPSTPKPKPAEARVAPSKGASRDAAKAPVGADQVALDRLAAGASGDPHGVLGAHPDGAGSVIIRTLRPDATGATVCWPTAPPSR